MDVHNVGHQRGRRRLQMKGIVFLDHGSPLASLPAAEDLVARRAENIEKVPPGVDLHPELVGAGLLRCEELVVYSTRRATAAQCLVLGPQRRVVSSYVGIAARWQRVPLRRVVSSCVGIAARWQRVPLMPLLSDHCSDQLLPVHLCRLSCLQQ